ncbi:MAG: CRISPR-associated endoribonuclease Cas6 [Bacillota bacterium]
MRLTVTLNNQGDIVLPLHHNHLLQAAIYHQIEQPALRSYLHEQGFMFGQRKFKLFTFSRLFGGRLRVDKTNQRMIFSPPLYLAVCSPIPLLTQEIGNGFLRQGRLRLGDCSLSVEKVVASDENIKHNSILVRMLSPVVMYSTLEKEDARYTYYYSPFEPRFCELILANLAKKHLLIFGKPADETGFEILPTAVKEKDFKVLKYKGTVIKGWMGTYQLQGDPQLLGVALGAGLGGKNAQGFGCCELLKGGEDSVS